MDNREDSREKLSEPQEVLMRSELIFNAERYVPNRYLLMRAAANAIRKLHRPDTRIADTVNDVFARFGRNNLLVAQGDKASDAVTQSRRAA
jgi:hypothetical protein